jgi:hypothetical protein
VPFLLLGQFFKTLPKNGKPAAIFIYIIQTNYSGQKESVNATSHSHWGWRRPSESSSTIFYPRSRYVVKMRNLTGHVGVHGWQGPDRNERTVSVRYNIYYVNFYRVQ